MTEPSNLDRARLVLEGLKTLAGPHFSNHSSWPGVRNKLILDQCKREGLPGKIIYSLFITDANKVRGIRGSYILKHLTDEALVTFFDKLENAPKTRKPTTKAPLVHAGASFSDAAPVDQSVMTMSLPPNAVPSGLQVSSISSAEVSYVPAADQTFVKWGDYEAVEKIIESKRFFPLFIAGMSGNGKTMMVQQACANTGREFIRVQISPETDEDDLIGGFRLIAGETVFAKGPATIAAERGALLLIDEIDRGTNKIMCLQGVLEGKPFLLKKTGELIVPAHGFNVIATANTSGRGSEDGRYSAAQIIDDAFLERFVATIEQPFAPIASERNIVLKHMALYGVNDTDFADKLVAWSMVIRKTFEAEGVEDVISTRRLCHIVSSYAIFKSRRIAIEMCIARFGTETRSAFMNLYTKIDIEVDGEHMQTE